MPHFVESASTITCRALEIRARFVSASARFGVVSPALPSKRAHEEQLVDVQRADRQVSHRADQRRARVRTPPVRMTVCCVGSPSEAMVSATWWSW